MVDLTLWVLAGLVAVAGIGWLLSGLAMAPVKDSYQRLRQFTADASHELRNPIAVIQTNVQVALADPDPSLQQDQLQVIERLTRRLGRLVDDLLFLARQDSSLAPLKSEPIDLDYLLKEVIEEQQAIATDKALALSLHPSSNKEGYRMQGDRDQLSRLFTNLIGNAIQYTPATGKVEVTLQRLKPNGILQVQVKDTGIGVPAESLPRLFDRFYRVDPARSSTGSKTTGSGLGLAIAKVIVENHHGQIQVESAPNQGTTFTVTLPSLRPETRITIPV
jgi:OmpR-family two-component system manganese-sensing sensor histidine kinase